MNHFHKKCLQLVFLLGFSCWETLLFLSRTWERAGKVTKTCHERVCLCVFFRCNDLYKESWVPSQCCFPLLASLGQVLLLLFLFLVLLVAVAHGAWCIWTAAREPYQSDAETDGSDQEGWEESFAPCCTCKDEREIRLSLTSLSVLRRPASSVKQHQSPSRPVRPVSIPEFTSQGQLCVQNMTCDSVSDGPLLDLNSLTRFGDFAGERPSCEDPQPLDGYEGWSSSSLAAHHSDDLAASGCLERNPKLGTNTYIKVIEAYRNIKHTKRYPHIKPSQNTSAHTY